MRHVFWLFPGRLAGRPGPDRQPWDLRELRGMGIDAVLTLNDGEACDPDRLEALDFEHLHVPLPDREPPDSYDEEVCYEGLPVAYDFVRAQNQRERAVLVHCSAGKDRTGMLMSYVLIRDHGFDVDAAIERVREVRPRAITAYGWEPMARRVLTRLSAELPAED